MVIRGKYRPNELHRDALWDWDGRKAEQAKYGSPHEAELGRRLEKLSLVCRAMWTLIQDKVKVTDKELIDRTTEVDLLDGKADGRVSVPARECASCKRTIAPRHDCCLYCGGKKLIKSVFETV